MIKDPSPRISVFESLRGVLSFWVLFAHVGLFAAITPDISGPARLIGIFNAAAGYSVNIFMILSGFVIFFLLDKSREGCFRFIFRRFFRLYPVFVLAFCVGVLLNPVHQYIHAHAPWSGNDWIKNQLLLAQNDARFLFQHILTHLPMLHGIVPENLLSRTDAAFSGPGWSISVEWQFYLIAPLLFALSRRLRGFIFLFALVLLWPRVPRLFPGVNHGEAMRGFVMTQISWFYVGMAFFDYYKDFAGFSPKEAKIRKIITVLLLIYVVSRDHYYYPIIIWLFFFGMAVCHRKNPGGLAEMPVRLFSAGWLQYLGQISYPVYLLHWPIIIVASRLVLACNPQIDQLLAYAILMVAVPVMTVLVAHIVHVWVELPGIRWARNFRPVKPVLLTPPPGVSNP